jgi:hypothetical protein
MSMPAPEAHLSLIRFSSSPQAHPNALCIVHNHTWGLITRKFLEQQHAIVAIPLKVPCLTREIIIWRETVLQGIFKSVDLSSDAPPPTITAPEPSYEPGT